MKTALLKAAALLLILSLSGASVRADEPLSYQVDLAPARSGFADKEFCWVHARAGAIPAGASGNPGTQPLVVMTMQQLKLSGSDVFYPLHELVTADLGKSWSPAVEIPSMHRQTYQPGQQPLATGAKGFEQLLQPGDETIVSDYTPQWHAASKSLLGIGHTVWYRNNGVMTPRPRATAYAVRSAHGPVWSEWKVLELPESLKDFQVSGAGCVQRYDLPNGEILLPVYGAVSGDRHTAVTVLRCRFDGEELSYVSHGNTLSVSSRRGLGEPSLTKFGNRFYLTLRHDDLGYVCSSDDGLNFSEPRPWTFDDGTDLGNYNTQQHWVTHSDGLYLVYTRRGANNDHVFRHRAPLFMARVDPEQLHVVRQTEQILVPQRGARLGNFGVVDVSPQETWVTAAEWMQPRPPKGAPEQYGSDNSVFVARIQWSRPNQLVK